MYSSTSTRTISFSPRMTGNQSPDRTNERQSGATFDVKNIEDRCGSAVVFQWGFSCGYALTFNVPCVVSRYKSDDVNKSPFH